jgi:hypothetical protein
MAGSKLVNVSTDPIENCWQDLLRSVEKVAQHLYANQNRMNFNLTIVQYCPDLRIAVVYIQIKTGIDQLQCIT